MQSLKTYLLEGLIQAAILLSLCGVRVDVGVELGRGPLELGPTSALPPAVHTHLHNLRNSLEEGGTSLHPKSPDLDQFFTTRRLLGWVRSLDRLQVPQTELETWLVQQDPSPLPVRLLHSAPDRLILPQQTRDTRDPQQGWAEPVEEWVEPAEEPGYNPAQVDRQHEETADGDMSPSETHHTHGTRDWDEGDTTEGGETEEDQNSSLQECLRLLESFPLTHDPQVCDPGPPSTESPPAVAQSPPSDMEQHWQDLMDLMEPQSSDVEMLNLLEPDAQVVPPAEQGSPLMDSYVLAEPTGPRSDQELLHLVPSEQLDDLPSSAPVLLSLPLPSPSLLPEDLPPSFLLDEGELEELLGEAAMLEEVSLLELDLQEEEEEGFGLEMSHRLQQEGYLDPELTQRTSRLSLSMDRKDRQSDEWSEEESRPQDSHTTPDVADELDSDSGLSLDSSHSPPSPTDSEASSYSSASSSSSAPSPLSTGPSPMELQVTIKEEPLDEEEQLGAVGGHFFPHQDTSKHIFSPFYPDQKLFNGFPWLQQVTHDHTYNQPSQSSPKISSRPFKSSPKHEKPYKIHSHLWSRDEKRARTHKIPFSNELIVNLPVEEFNDLLTSYRLDEEQLNLIRDIRRRGKNKIAAQNCRKRKMDTLTGLEKDVTGLRRRRSQLLKEKQEALRSLQELRQRVTRLYQDVFSGLRDSEGRPLDVHEYMLSFERDGSVDVVSRRQRGREKGRRRHKDKK